MIPSCVPAQTPPGERELFLRLRDDPSTADWTVLHSLDIACHRTQVTGECDFVVIIPRKGVLCVEVKSHKSVYRNGGEWYYGTQPDPDARGPFKQASGAMHSIRARLLKKRPDFNRVVFWSCVVLPYASGKMLTGEWHAWQLIDKAVFSAAPPGRWLLAVIDNARKFLSGCSGATWFHPESQEPYPEQCKAIADVLRPDFEFFESPRARQERLEKELKYYTQEQCVALDAMANNPRVAFSGPAGTGKSLLAMEAARRSAHAGRRTLLLCFNRFLGMWLSRQVPSTPGLKVSTLHGLMLEITGRKPDSGESEDPSFWRNVLPLAAIDKLLGSGKEEDRFDELIIDEAQDVLWNNYIDFADLLLRGGFCTGRWRLFGDFEKQAIFGPGHFPLSEFLQTRGNSAPEFCLRTNCRNTPRVASYIRLLGGLDPDYHRVLRPDDGVNPGLSFYRNEQEQLAQIRSCLSALAAQKVPMEDIVLLSPGKDSAATRLSAGGDGSLKLVPLPERSPGKAGYATIQSFKGLESPAVLLTDVNSIDSAEAADLIYTGLSRALHYLHIFASTDTRPHVSKRIIP